MTIQERLAAAKAAAAQDDKNNYKRPVNVPNVNYAPVPTQEQIAAGMPKPVTLSGLRGVNRDAYDSAVRANYTVRQMAEAFSKYKAARDAGVRELYSSRPEVSAQRMERMQSGIDDLSARLDEARQASRGWLGGGGAGVNDSPAKQRARELERELAQLQTAQAQAQTKSKLGEYSALMKRPDYAGHSTTTVGDELYNFINNVNGARDYKESMSAPLQQGERYGPTTTQRKYGDYTPYSFMTDDEIGIYNYLYAKEGETAAAEYLGVLKSALGQREYEERQREVKGVAERFPILASVASVPQSLAGNAIGGVDLLLQNIRRGVTGRPVDYYSGAQISAQTSDMARGAVAGALEENTGASLGGVNIASFLYNNVMSMADVLAANTILPGGGTLALLGTGAGANAARDIAARGGSDNQALVGGLAAGTLEALFERFTLGNLNALKNSTKKGILAAAGNVAKSMGVNASEEGLTELSNILFDALTMGDVSNWETSIKNYMAMGMSESAAKSQTVKDMFAQVGTAAASGAVMGLGFGAAGSIQGAKRSKAAQEQSNPLIINRGATPVDYSRFISDPEYRQQMIDEALGKTAAEQNAPAVSGDSGALVGYNALEADNFMTGVKNRVLGYGSNIIDFVKNALSDKGSVERLYLGKIPDATANTVSNSTGIDISGFNAVIPSDAVRHAMKNHSDIEVEAQRGQIALTPETFELLPQVLANPDSVSLSSKTDANGRQALIFEKNMGDLIVTVQGVSNGKHSLVLDTVYVIKKDRNTRNNRCSKPRR